jgi:hypothetical protein
MTNLLQGNLKQRQIMEQYIILMEQKKLMLD